LAVELLAVVSAYFPDGQLKKLHMSHFRYMGLHTKFGRGTGWLVKEWECVPYVIPNMDYFTFSQLM
jgi:hypothetical protein